MSTEPAEPAEDIVETRRAVRLVGFIALLVVLGYLLVGLAIDEDATMTRYGRATHEIQFVTLRAEAFDREEAYGDAPVVWIVGSSITRESFDADRIRYQLKRAGVDLGVEKYAFDRGAPVFAWAFLDRIDLRPGDHVVTTIGYDNFRGGWIDYHGNVAGHLHYLVPPSKLFRIESLRWADRLDYSLAHLPLRSFWQYRDTYRDGVQDWLYYYFDPTQDKRPEVLEEHPRQPFQNRNAIRGYATNRRLETRNVLAVDDLQPQPGQVNWDGLTWWTEEVRAAGATPWVVYVPHNPLYFERFVDEATVRKFHDAVEPLDGFESLSQLPVDKFMDFRHPNPQGRAVMSQELAELLLAAEERP